MRSGMKTGKVAQIFNRDPKTILNWTQEVTEFLSDGAVLRGSGGKTQREYTEADIVVLNTVEALRRDGMNNWDDIRAALRSGQRVTELPPGMATVGTGESSLVIYQRMVQLQAVHETTLEKLAEAEERINTLEQAAKEREDAYREEIGALRERIGMYRGVLKASGINFDET